MSILFFSFLVTIVLAPSQMVLSLCALVIMMSLKISLELNLSFMSYSFTLSILGGLMIIFLYSASLTPNTINKNYPKKFIFLLIPFMIIAPNTSFYSISPISITIFPFLLIFSGSYLLLTLLMILKIISFEKGPLRGK